MKKCVYAHGVDCNLDIPNFSNDFNRIWQVLTNRFRLAKLGQGKVRRLCCFSCLFALTLLVTENRNVYMV